MACGRHYLGDRLLAQGLSWLEGAVVEQIGLCFPSRFPQEMLRNLAESEELQQQFYLFRLQEQDKWLVELDTGPDEVSVLVGWGEQEAAHVPHRDPGACAELPSCPGAGDSLGGRCAGGEGAGPVPTLLACVPILLHG